MMLEIPLYIALFLYLFVVALYVVYYLLILYHIMHSASFTLASFLMTFLTFAASVLIVYGTYTLLLDVDWQQIALTINLDQFGRSGF